MTKMLRSDYLLLGVYLVVLKLCVYSYANNYGIRYLSLVIMKMKMNYIIITLTIVFRCIFNFLYIMFLSS